MVTIATIVTSFLLKKLQSSNSDFNNTVLFAVPTRKNYSKKSTINQQYSSNQKLYGATLTLTVSKGLIHFTLQQYAISESFDNFKAQACMFTRDHPR